MIDDAEVHAALEDIRGIMRLDGADFELESWDADAGVVGLRLLLEDASCAECVITEPMLSDITLASIRKALPAVTGVRIDDPRT